MGGGKHRASVERRLQMMIQVFSIITILVQILSVTSLYVPGDFGGFHPVEGGRQILSRRQDSDDDSDEDDMDSNASAPYQNQPDDNTNAQPGDGYEESEPDGPYGETPREEEGQADLERFFDDHLGASERDGMDKENLPSNLIEYVSLSPPLMDRSSAAASVTQQEPPVFIYNLPKLPDGPMMVNHPSPTVVAQAESRSIASYSRKPSRRRSSQGEPMNNIEMRYLRLPGNRMIIVHHQERDIVSNKVSDPRGRGRANVRIRVSGDEILSPSMRQQQQPRRMDDSGSGVVAAEDDDMDRVYVTKALDKPFKIDALGGYDPEQDFQAAEKDLEDSRDQPPAASLEQRRRGRKRHKQPRSADYANKEDIIFDDGKTDTMFNDASETDEITFAQDEPYQTDLEAEMRSQAFDKPTPAATADDTLASTGEVAPEVRIVPRNRRVQSETKQPQDDSGSEWINDGVDEMEIPSQSHQDKVLDKAARQQEEKNALASAAAEAQATSDGAQEVDTSNDPLSKEVDSPIREDEAEAPAETTNDEVQEDQQPSIEMDHQQQIDPENQRMPNANYLRNYTDEPEDYEENESL